MDVYFTSPKLEHPIWFRFWVWPNPTQTSPRTPPYTKSCHEISPLRATKIVETDLKFLTKIMPQFYQIMPQFMSNLQSSNLKKYIFNRMGWNNGYVLPRKTFFILIITNFHLVHLDHAKCKKKNRYYLNLPSWRW